MNKIVLALLVFVSLGADRPPLRFSVRGKYDEATVTRYKRYFCDGWYLLSDCIGTKSTPPNLVYVEDIRQAKLVIDMNGSTDHSAGRTTFQWGKSCSGYMELYVPNIDSFAEGNRPLIAAHELAHFYFHLPDDYKSDNPDNGCLMTRHDKYKYSGKFCDNCQQIVNDYYKGKVR